MRIRSRAIQDKIGGRHLSMVARVARLALIVVRVGGCKKLDTCHSASARNIFLDTLAQESF